MSNKDIIYGQEEEEEDFRAKMAKFGARLDSNNGKRVPRKALVKSRAAPSRKDDAISINLDSIKSRIKFSRLVIYSANCIANLSENKFNCHRIVECGGIQRMKQIMDDHSNNPAVMKEVARTLTNISKSNPMYSQEIVELGLIKQCINALKSNPREVGIFAIQIMESVSKSSTDSLNVTQEIIKNDGLSILENILKSNLNDSELCSSIIKFINTLMTMNPNIAKQFGNISIWNHIINAMKYNAIDGDVAISGIKVLQKLASLDKNYAITIQQLGAVEIISNCMQSNPYHKLLTQSGAAALRLFASQDDVSRALNVLLDFGKYDNIAIYQALGLMTNLALIQENAQFIVTKGGLDCLMNVINYKCKMKDLSPEDVSIVANSVRAIGRLLEDPQNVKLFVNKGGVNLFKDMLEYYDHEEAIMNAVVDAIENTSSLIPISCVTNVVANHPEYNVLMQKFVDLIVPLLSDKNHEIMQQLLNAGLLKAIQKSLTENYKDPDTVIANMAIIKQIVTSQPKLAQQIANENIQGIQHSIQSNQDNPKVLSKILDALHLIGKADDSVLKYLTKEAKIEDLLIKIVQSQAVSDETACVIKQFVENVSSDNIDVDLQNIMIKLKELGMGLNQMNKSMTESEVKEDGNGVINQINIDIQVRNPSYHITSSNDEKFDCDTLDAETLFSKLKPSPGVPMDPTFPRKITERLQGGDEEIYNYAIQGGGLGIIMSNAHTNIGNPLVLNPSLDAMGTLSSDDRLKTLLGMHGTIRLILEVIRTHPNDIELLDKCCYILSNLSFNNQQNMTSIIELGGVKDIIDIIQTHDNVNFICESAINVLVNLCHNSDKNKVLIARSGGGKATIAVLRKHNRCLNDGDIAVVVSCFRCIANLAFVADNVKQLIKLDTVGHVMDTMNQNADKRDLIQMGVVCLANLSSHQRTADRMINLGVLDLCIKVSQSYPDAMEIQRTCLGCIGNLMNQQSNAFTFIDKKGHLRIYEVMQELVFEESVVITALKLLKVLATNTDTANEMAISGGCKVVAEIMEENKGNEEIMSLGCQALCKMIVTMEAAKHITKDGLCDVIIDIAKDNNNWANIRIMNELIKVIVNVSSIEENAQLIARNGAVQILRSIEAHKTNAVFLNNAAMALTKMSVHPTSSRPLVKRGAVAVILQSMQNNPNRKAILAKYVRTLTNLLYTEHKTSEELSKNNGREIVEKLVNQFPDYQPLQQEYNGFNKATRFGRRPFHVQMQQPSKVRTNLDNTLLRFLLSGTICKKYALSGNGKAKKKFLKVNDDCSLLLFEDPNGQKAPKQLNLKSIKSVIRNVESHGMDKCNSNNSWIIISSDPNGREYHIGLECKTNLEMEKWINGLQTIMQILGTITQRNE